MARLRCPFCHELISRRSYDQHIQQHTELRSDGQMQDHVTLPPEQRHEGSLEEIPSVYHHQRCGQCTKMPDEIIRSYLKNPFLYNNSTFCAGCGAYFHTQEFRWVDTGETLYDYNQNLQAEYRRRNPTLLALFCRFIGSWFQKPTGKTKRERRRLDELDPVDEDVEDIDDYLEMPKPRNRSQNRKS